ncbi:hypothetical protein Lbir_2417 [Legionella birminghamensis]|uniref:Uncharacterized protein n=1 Tax=Legionella birminghamensis TaxID=28083 RepID=A0A378IM49_9GAMM|nr:hypothetical protein [Legionella birminghamensis]KTC68884.1 hypothetical protein Lbir_2417 [Legionella birminghamensis]STX33174.1 Uncharacterised protein [Legionella birminghamensis]
MSGTTQSSSAETVETVSTPSAASPATPASTAPAATAPSDTDTANKKAAQDTAANAAIAADAAKAKTTMAAAQPAAAAASKKEEKAAPAEEESFLKQDIDPNEDAWLKIIKEWINLINELNEQFTSYAGNKLKGAAMGAKELGGQLFEGLKSQAANGVSTLKDYFNPPPKAAEVPPGHEGKPSPDAGLALDAEHNISAAIPKPEMEAPEDILATSHLYNPSADYWDTGDELDLGETMAPKADMPLASPEMSALPESPQAVLGSSFADNADFQLGELNPTPEETASVMTTMDEGDKLSAMADDGEELNQENLMAP